MAGLICIKPNYNAMTRELFTLVIGQNEFGIVQINAENDIHMNQLAFIN